VAYVSLYRKYRPQTFEDVVGQGHVIQTLVHALEEDRLHHAYLFTGPRGTGKTSTARLLAKAINCEEGPTPSPCNACEHCTAIADGSSVDVIELDMASHGGVDDARELRDRALYAPARARRKVYILDEVHMASTAAFNALLKLIEEPPAHVLFAMATTDPQKVLPTILSRVQRLDLRRVSATDVAGNVRKLCELEGYTIDDGAVEAIVRAGDGSLRDTQSVLEQVLAFAGTEVTTDAVAQVLGQTPAERVFESVDLLAGRDLAGLLALVQGLLDDGHDLRRFTLELVQHLRDLLVLQVAPDRPDLVDATDDRRRRLQAQTTALPGEALLRAVGILADTVAEQRQGSPRLPLELALATLAVPGADGDVVELADRVARLEAGAPPAAPAARRSAPEAAPSPAPDVDDVPPPTTTDRGAGADVARERPPSSRPPSSRPPSSRPSAPGPTEPSVPEPAGLEASAPEPSAPASPTGGTSAPRPVAEAPAAASDKETPLQARARARSAAAGGSAAPDASSSPAPPVASAADTSSAPASPSADTEAPEGASAAADVAATAAADPGDDTGAAPAGGGDELEVVQRHWEGILDLVKRRSRRCHAVFEPATVGAVARGIVTLRYAPRYASFHAQNATKGEYADVLKDAIERACGLRLRVDAVVEGSGDDRRRPVPPTVTPDDARTPVLDDGGPTPDEVAEVREAEHGTPRGDVFEAEATDRLLATELGAEFLDERPPTGTAD
jgi:DNA polymerase III subunit gamma/tau